MRHVVSLLIVFAVAEPALAQTSPYDGAWGIGDIPECIADNGAVSTCPAVTIDDGEFRGQESVCSMVVVGPVPGMPEAQVYDLSCQGEGEAWAFRAIFHRDMDGRLTVLNETGPFVYLPLIGAGDGGSAPSK